MTVETYKARGTSKLNISGRREIVEYAIRAGWEADGLTPKTYTAGSWGPSAAIALAERDGVTWHE